MSVNITKTNKNKDLEPKYSGSDRITTAAVVLMY